MLSISHIIIKNLLSFIENDNLITMLNGIFKCCLLFLFLLYMVREKYIEKLEFSLKEIDIAVLITSVLGIISISFFPLPEFSLFKQDTIENYVVNAIDNQSDIFIFISMVVTAPILEEIIFRGVIQRGLSTKYSPVISIVISSALFAVLHLSLVGTFLFGLFIGWIYYRTKNLLYCILMHAVVNLISFGMRFVIFKEYVTMDNFTGFFQSHNLLIGSVLLVIFLGSMFYLYLTFKKHDNKIDN